jgi:diguanylate cyclase (GGDEF)-like protein/PAS domain S-box-containing protein
MRTPGLHAGTAIIAASAVSAGFILAFAGWLPAGRTFEFCGLLLTAVLLSALVRPVSQRSSAALPLAATVEFTSLFIFGPHATLLVAASGTFGRAFADPDRSEPAGRVIVNLATAVAAIEAAGFVHGVLGGTLGHFSWPWQALPIAAAIMAYAVVHTVSAEIVAPLLRKASVNPEWATHLLRTTANHVIAAGLAVAFVELIDHRMWEVLPVVALPLACAYWAYADYIGRLEQDHRRLEVIESIDEGMAVVDSMGRVTLWSDALERILECPRHRVLGHVLVAAVPGLSKTELPRALADVQSTRVAKTLTQVPLPSVAGGRTVQIKVLPVADGVTLLWQNVSEQRQAEQSVKRNEERLALAAEGANDGLWEWDLQTQEFFFSGRWNAMIGLPASAGIGRPDEWLGRVHADDLAPLKEALQAHLAGKTEHFQHEHRIRHEDGSYRWFLCRGLATRAAGRRSARIAGSLTDTTERALAQERLRSAGFLDSLTGLCNRAVFVEGLGRRLEEFKQRRLGGRFAVLYLDLDRFKVVNDSLGHLVGDELLIAVSRRLESCVRPGDTLARLGGDEFAILLNGLVDDQQANAIAFKIQEALRAPIAIAGREVFTSASIGIAFGLAEYNNPDEIMRDADTAMYHAKSRGKARHELFDADMHARVRDRLGLESDLRHAVSKNDFEVVYQPIVSLASGMCVGFESLVRWTRNGEPISPVTFIPMAEELGLIEPIGTWVLQEACRTFADWQRRFPDGGLDCITVNVSSRQLMQQNFMRIVEQAVHKAGLKPCDLRIEITETALMDSPTAAAELLRELRDFGVKIYLDDFGTGYSSLSHLHKLPVDALKIDRSFVKSLLLPDRPAIVESVLALARTLNTSVVAEGIESDRQARELERLGCTHAQGFLFSKPLSMRKAEEMLIANQPLGPKRTPEDAAGKIVDPGAIPAGPFEWPAHIPVRATAADSATRTLVDTIAALSRA